MTPNASLATQWPQALCHRLRVAEQTAVDVVCLARPLKGEGLSTRQAVTPYQGPGFEPAITGETP